VVLGGGVQPGFWQRGEAGDEFGRGLGDMGEIVGPERVRGAQAKAAGDALRKLGERDGCESMADAADLGALAGVVIIGAMAGGAGRPAFGCGFGRLGFGGFEVGAVSHQGGGQGDQPAEGVGGSGGSAGPGGIEGGSVIGETQNGVA
jgi:hypothetical protein